MQWLGVISDQLIKEKIIASPLVKSTNVSGGCINECYKVENQTQSFFVKVNSRSAYPEMFAKEIKGLALLRDSNTIRIPRVLSQFDQEDQSFLILEWIEKGNVSKQFWMKFGSQLAALHQISYNNFGLQYDNYIGSLPQINTFKKEWHVFYFENRLIPQLEIGIQKGWATTSIFKYAENIAKVIEDEFPNEQPALLHGDLWSGNFLIGAEGEPFLIDPAVYYGFREVELSFTKLFGGFHAEFYEGYQHRFPLAEDFHKRIKIHQLYPLLVHANLFGGYYIQEVVEVFRKY